MLLTHKREPCLYTNTVAVHVDKILAVHVDKIYIILDKIV